MSILSFCTHSCTEAAWPGMPLLMLISTAITVLMHSYSSDIADVLHAHTQTHVDNRHIATHIPIGFSSTVTCERRHPLEPSDK